MIGGGRDTWKYVNSSVDGGGTLENMSIVRLMVTDYVTVDTAVSDYIVRTTGTRQSNDVFASNIFEVR